MKINILLTGGAGYIGSHTALEFLSQDYEIIVLDNLVNSSYESIKRVEQLSSKKITFYKGDIRDSNILEKIFTNHNIECVVHFAGLKSVGESSKIPLEYYDVNIAGTISLCKAMEKFSVYKLVFSSSATVYGDAEIMPISESHPTQKPTNPYGYSKFMVEEILQDMSKANSNWSIALLRYFNPIGAHESGLIGEDPNDIPNNLVPYVAQVAIGKLPYLNVFGNDYPTEDGTGVRDYIHVVDLANGHLKAMEYLNGNSGAFIWNLGTGQGYSVLDVVNEYSKVSEKNIPYEIKPRRDGDIAVCYADPKKAKLELNWEAQYTLIEMLRDSWNWQSKNPNGYK
ncbi:UDP-glucose 4-epimerase GalE [Wohlfahrtiimonas chitiniclastica]|uniref:UDP-glucose 4-epimerase GalE n=1 Tax=Wohlfahrtiimonas chitiniclastica TaxID=400946 RepID=UPI001BCE86EE|nr:UDP-glucose 4-epimerase GalE [Wohlfahrtiimonas chitiniclastica]MBS7838553.1 UDP-glucose 4-epimerase GalE [Wohlfahrtiimonas chitiniclastica]